MERQNGLNLAKVLSKREMVAGRSNTTGGPSQKLCSTLADLKLAKLKFSSTSTSNLSHSALRNNESAVFGLQFSEYDPTLLISSHADSGIRAHDTRLEKQIWEAFGHTDCANGGIFLKHNMYASFSDDASVCVWDIRSHEKPVQRLLGHHDWVKNVSWIKEKQQLISSGLDSTIRCFDLSKGDSEITCKQPSLHFNGLFRSKVDPDGRFLIITTTDAAVYFVDLLDLEAMPTDAYTYYLTTENCSTPSRRPFAFSENRNRFSFIHYVPQVKRVTVGLSLDISENCCIVRHGCIAGSRQISQVQSFEWISIYPIGINRDKIEMNRNYTRHPNNPLETDIHHHNYNNWNSLNLPPNVERSLLSRSKSAQARLYMLYSQWNDSEEIERVPQDIHDAAFYRDCQTYSSGIIKEPAFSNDGSFILNPIVNGFEILKYGNQLGTYPGPEIMTAEINAQDLMVHNQYFSPTKSTCVTVKASRDNLIVVTGDTEGQINWYNPFRL